MITLLLMPLLLSLLDRIALDRACTLATHHTPRCGSALLRSADHTALMRAAHQQQHTAY
jgi:hypothetical protein